MFLAALLALLALLLTRLLLLVVLIVDTLTLTLAARGRIADGFRNPTQSCADDCSPADVDADDGTAGNKTDFGERARAHT